tara:strand:- start:2736 stop:2888 length:153 start_codon:yes stop_codon:yes gene_type:complete
MNQNAMLIALLIGALFFLRQQSPGRPIQGQMETGNPGPGIPGTTGMWGVG